MGPLAPMPSASIPLVPVPAGDLTEPPPLTPLPPGGLEGHVSPQAPAPGRTIYLPSSDAPRALPPIMIPTSARVQTCADALRVILPYARAIIRGSHGLPGQPGHDNEQLARLEAAEGILRAIEAGDGAVHGIGGDAPVWPPEEHTNGGAAGAPRDRGGRGGRHDEMIEYPRWRNAMICR